MSLSSVVLWSLTSAILAAGLATLFVWKRRQERAVNAFSARVWELTREAGSAARIGFHDGPKSLGQLGSAVNNLLENAIKYSPKQKPINFFLKKDGDKIKLKVSDEGIGIPDNEKTKIFERFYRIGNEEVRKTKGTGLGLYLCKKIAEDHNADIRVTNNHPTGSIFVVDFKK